MANEPPPAQLEASYAHVKRFAAGSDESLAFLDENGFVVIAHALTSPEAEHAVGLTWDYLEGLDTVVASFRARASARAKRSGLSGRWQTSSGHLPRYGRTMTFW